MLVSRGAWDAWSGNEYLDEEGVWIDLQEYIIIRENELICLLQDVYENVSSVHGSDYSNFVKILFNGMILTTSGGLPDWENYWTLVARPENES